jgi:hypothetical protein
MLLGLLGWDHFHYMMHQSLALWTLLRLDMLVFLLLWLWIGNKDGVCCMQSTFFWTLMNNKFGFPQYKQRLFVRQCCFFWSMKG